MRLYQVSSHATSRVALFSEVPLLDLVAPLFGTALMVHLFHRMVREQKS